LIAVFLFVAAFLGLEAYHFAIHAMPVALPAASPRLGNPMPTTIAIVQAEQTPISNAEVEAMVQRAVAQAGGLEEIIEPGDSVVLKVNLVEDGWSPGDGVTTAGNSGGRTTGPGGWSRDRSDRGRERLWP